MAGLQDLNLSKNWTSSSDFPSVEPDETQARKDMQCLFDEIKNYINDSLIPGIKSGDITKIEMNDAGNLVCTKADGKPETFALGRLLVADIAVNESGELVVTMTDGTENNLGKVGGDVDLSDYLTKSSLSSSVTSASTTTPANSYAVKQAYDKAVAAASSGGSLTSGSLRMTTGCTLVSSKSYWYKYGRVVFLSIDVTLSGEEDDKVHLAISNYPQEIALPGMSTTAAFVGGVGMMYQGGDPYQITLGFGGGVNDVMLFDIENGCIPAFAHNGQEIQISGTIMYFSNE